MAINHDEPLLGGPGESCYRQVAYQTRIMPKGVWLVAINIKAQEEPLERFDWQAFIDKGDTACFSPNYLLSVHRLQRLAGRLCAKLALACLNGTGPEQHTIEISCKPANSGQPLSASGYISISHSGDWVVAAAGVSPVGIDIQRIGNFAEYALKYVFRAREIRHCNARKLTLIWSLKEAYLKAKGRGLIPFVRYLEAKQNGAQWVIEDSFSPLSKGAEITTARDMDFELYDDYVLAICLIQGSSPQKADNT